MTAQIESYILQEEDGESFYLGDLSHLQVQHYKWIELLPRVEPFYSVKCNSTTQLLETLSKLPGMGFNCASQTELSLALSMGTPVTKILYSHPCKALKHLKFAKEQGIKMMTFDSESELKKIKAVFPDSELIIRIRPSDSTSPLEKFGVSPKEAENLLRMAKSLNLNVIGVSFHLESDSSPTTYYNTIKNSRDLFNYVRSAELYNFHLIDIGGGFEDTKVDTEEISLFEKKANAIRDALDEFFPDESEDMSRLRIIAEPGKYFAAKVFSLAVSVIGKKLLMNGDQVTSVDEDQQVEKVVYFVNEGMFSAFGSVKRPVPKGVFREGRYQEYDESFELVYKSVIWGPTCREFDCVAKEIEIPMLDVGDWIVFEGFGAYTMSVSSNFNGFESAKIYWVN